MMQLINKCYWLLNHEPTENQKEELRTRFNAQVVFPSSDIVERWKNIPTNVSLDLDYFEPILSWVSQMENNDIAVIQGEMTATHYLIKELNNKNKRVFASVTDRVAKEERIGEKVIRSYIFEHKCFREYF